MRGLITEEIRAMAKDLLGIEDIGSVELRLMPYVNYCLMNSMNLNPANINQKDREILSEWRKKGWLTGGASDLQVSKEFWDAINQLLWLGYVDYG